MNIISNYKKYLSTLPLTVDNVIEIEADAVGEQLFKIEISNTDLLLKKLGVSETRIIQAVMGRITDTEEVMGNTTQGIYTYEFIIHFNYVDYIEECEDIIIGEEEADFNEHKIRGFWNEEDWDLTYESRDD